MARTFLEVISTGSFIAAARNLHVTQTTVTARIQTLEAELGCRLFVRNRSGARLTRDGERFSGHASQLVQTWAAARRELPLPQGSVRLAVLGCELSLWNPLMVEWLLRLRAEQADLAVRAEVNEAGALHEKLKFGLIDTALVHRPDYWPGMQVEQLIEEKLVMVRAAASAEPYVYVDWGEAFRRLHDAALPEHARASLTVDLGPLALQLLLSSGGSGYFRTRVVQPYLDSGQLHRVPQTPEFSYPAYLVYPRDIDNDTLPSVLSAIRNAAQATPGKWASPPAS